MPLKITKASEPIVIDAITTCIYAQPGIGKTTLAFTTEKPLLIDFDMGTHRAKNRRDVVRVSSWDEVTAITQEDLAPYRTVIIDTAGRALDALSVHLIKGDPKMARRDGSLSLQGFGALKSVFTAWMKMVKSFGINVVLICHMDEMKDGDETKERLDVQGASKNEIYKASDLMGRIYFRNNKRILNFSPNDTGFGKNPAELDPIDIPHYNAGTEILGGAIARTIEGINKLTAEQTEVAALLADWKGKVDAASEAKDFDALIQTGKDLDERIRENARRVLQNAAWKKGLVAKNGAFVPKDGAAPATNGTPANGTHAASNGTAAPAAAATPAAEREPGADDEDEANRKAAEPTPEEIEAAGKAAEAPAAEPKGRARRAAGAKAS